VEKSLLNKSKSFILFGVFLGVFLIALLIYKNTAEPQPSFNGERAWQDVSYQVSLGPRTSGSLPHQELRSWLTEELEKEGWTVEEQSCLDCVSLPVFNLVAKRGSGSPWIILGAHYDSRFLADRDPDPNLQTRPVPGGNDGASGVAVLLELARALPSDLNKEIWLVFFDAEDNGRIANHDWSMGSRVFVQYLVETEPLLPHAAIIVDMVGDEELTLYFEQKSDQALNEEIWATADELGYQQFIPAVKHNIIDDHVPFIEAGIPAIDIIDIEYPYWHTTADTADKVSIQSLEAVGATLLAWILK
jgi:hypothetical protein